MTFTWWKVGDAVMQILLGPAPPLDIFLRTALWQKHMWPVVCPSGLQSSVHGNTKHSYGDQMDCGLTASPRSVIVTEVLPQGIRSSFCPRSPSRLRVQVSLTLPGHSPFLVLLNWNLGWVLEHLRT